MKFRLIYINGFIILKINGYFIATEFDKKVCDRKLGLPKAILCLMKNSFFINKLK